MQIIISNRVSCLKKHIRRAGVHVIGERKFSCEMTNRTHIAIHAPEYMVIARTGVRGVDEALHGGNGVVFLAQQPAVVVTSANVLRGKRKDEIGKGEGVWFTV